MSPEMIAYACERLLEEGALDVWQTPITMKKGRAAVTLSLLCRLESRPQLTHVLFQHTSALGVRCQLLDRSLMTREVRRVSTPYGEVRVKVAWLEGEGDDALSERVSVEHEDAARVAREQGLSLAEVHRVVLSSRGVVKK